MVFQKMSSFKTVLLFLGVIAVLSACEEPEGIGLEVLPDGEEMPLAWVDTFTVEARTVYDDSIATANLASTYLIGDFGDPIFGRVQSQLYTQFLLSSSDVNFGTNPIIDSVIINLAYAGAYGNTDKLKGMQKFGVYKLDQTVELNDTVTYYSTNEHVIGDLIGQTEFRPDLYSDVIIGDDTIPLPPSLRFNLDNSFGQEILNSTNLISNDAFLTEFKGLSIKPEYTSITSGFGSILYFNMVSGYSRIEMHYHNDEDTLRFDLLINEDCATHTEFNHEFESTIDAAVVDSTVTGANRLYVQSMAGAKMKLDIPYLRNLNDLGIVAINKAELVLPIDETVITEYGSPNSLQVTAINEEGTSEFIVDFFEGSSHYGGAYDGDNNEYVFNIARHLQSILSAPEEPDYGLYILNSGNAVNARRGVFNGPAHPDRPLKTETYLYHN